MTGDIKLVSMNMKCEKKKSKLVLFVLPSKTKERIYPISYVVHILYLVNFALLKKIYMYSLLLKIVDSPTPVFLSLQKHEVHSNARIGNQSKIRK